MTTPSKQPSNFFTVLFVIILCSVSALILSVMATAIRSRQEKAKELDIAKQQLEAAQIYSFKGYFLVEKDGKYAPAKYDASKGILVEGEGKATAEQIYAVSQARLLPLLTDAQGKVTTFKKVGIDPLDYINENRVAGYFKLKEKLFYAILPNKPKSENQKVEPIGYVIPVAGFGLWGPIYGYIAVGPKADTVIGATWEGPQETPGLGAIIQDPGWQAQFHGKKIFVSPASGEPNYKSASLGITVVKGKVSDVYGSSPRAQSAVDGISGATLTGDGVTAAYKQSLAPYRSFFIMAEKANKDKKPLVE